MGQVPDSKIQDSPQYLLIGSGRLARHLRFYLQELELSFSTWDRSQSFDLLKAQVSTSTHILLAITDRSLVSFYEQHLASVNSRVIHFSGSLHDPRIISAHPMMSFGHFLFDAAFYRRIHFTLCGTHTLSDCLPGLPNSFSVIQPEQKDLYHALCVFSGNFSTLLWKTSWNELKKMGLPQEALDTYIAQTLRNFSQDPQNSLTGPFVRGDFETIQANLGALPMEMSEIYVAFLKLYSQELHSKMHSERGLQP